MKPVVLCIMDGIAINDEVYGNAVKQANTPNLDYLWEKYPHSLLEASGTSVGLPEGQMGNSEVGHINIGAGRVVYQSLQLINEKIKDNSFFENEEFLDVINHTKNHSSKLHILGLISDGGVHSHIDHLLALVDLAKKEGIEKLYFHLFTDGRDTQPRIAHNYIKTLEEKMKLVGIGKISTISGRYYAMDRDNRWDRIEKAYLAIALGVGENYNNSKEVIDANYDKGIDDEFIIPAVIDKSGIIEENDGLILFNFRPDRSRELFSVITNPKVNVIKRKIISNLKLVTMMPVSSEVISKPAFKLERLENTLGEYISGLGLRQLRIAETEKYPHVTYFFDGGEEKDLDGCVNILVPSPKVLTYDLKPEMSANEITDILLKELDKDIYDVVILNYANGDMVGHTGDFDATIKAVETVDNCVGKLYEKIKEKKGTLIVTADHGNADVMLDKNGNIVTSHSTNKVPFIIAKEGLSLVDGKLGDIAPTILGLLDIQKPSEMTGKNLIK